MKNKDVSLKAAAVFIGTIVGAGLASGQEILQFFTLYGFYGLFGIVICGILYIITGLITVKLSYKYKTYSYNELIYLSCGRYFGWVVDVLTTVFFFGGACIILSGSGSIFLESFKAPYIIGAIVMAVATAAVVFNSTDGLIFINSIIVPLMITLIVTICIMVFVERPGSYHSMIIDIVNSPAFKKNWLWSSLLYSSFNMLSTTGVISPMTRDIKDSKGMANGIIIGSVCLFILTLLMNIVLILNEPNIFRFSIPMLFVAKTIGPVATFLLSIIIWLEMFSTAVSDVFSLSKKKHHSFKINYRFSIVLILSAALPFIKIGFENLIKVLYPSYGFISFIYIICLIRLYLKK